MKLLRNLFLISFLFIFLSFTYSWSQLQENSISREELKKIIDTAYSKFREPNIIDVKILDHISYVDYEI